VAPIPYPQTATLRQRVLRAGGWIIAGYVGIQAIRLGGNLIMTRLLVPDMFGVLAIATMVTIILGMLSDIGLSQNIVQSRRGDDPAFLDTAWVVQVLRGVFLWLLALMLSMALHVAQRAGILPMNSAYASPVLPLVITVTSFSAVILGFLSTKVATAQRSFDQKRPIQIEVISQLAGLVVMIVIGLASHSIWALVAGGLISTVVVTVLSHAWMNGHPNRFRWEKNALLDLIDFGKWIFVSSAAFVLVTNGDRLLLGGIMDTGVLGLYAIAALIVGAIEGVLSRLFMAVGLPALSETARNNPSRLREVYYKLRVPGDLLLLFLTGLVFTAGQLVIDLLYDPRYALAGGMLQILGLSFFSARYLVTLQVYVAVGAPRYQTVTNLVRLLSLYTVVPTLYYIGGTPAAIWGIALHALATVPVIYKFNAKLGLNDFRRELLVLVALPAGFVCGSALNLMRG